MVDNSIKIVRSDELVIKWGDGNDGLREIIVKLGNKAEKMDNWNERCWSIKWIVSYYY